MSYAKAIAKMESVPEGERALLREVYFDGKDCSALPLASGGIIPPLHTIFSNTAT